LAKFREIADSVGALLLTDVSHIAGLIAAGQIPSPVGFAHVITFTTHKTMIGPRGACIITDNKAFANKIDKAVFPGEQGGPHINTIAALALTFKLAQTEEFKQLQNQILKNAVVFSDQLKARGLRVPYDGTDTHIVLLDCKSVKGEDHAYLSGDMGARILDIAGIVANRNTIPGDRSAFSATGVRFGSTWLTQRGFKEKEFTEVANIIADLLAHTTPYNMPGRGSPKRRAKVDFEALEQAKLKVKKLVEHTKDFTKISKRHSYPHYYDIEDNLDADQACFRISGVQIRLFMSYVFSSDIEALKPGQSQPTYLHTNSEDIKAVITCEDPITFTLTLRGDKAGLAGAWLRDLSDAYIKFDDDLAMRVPGPMRIALIPAQKIDKINDDPIGGQKPYYIGITKDHRTGEVKPEFSWEPTESEVLRKTPLYKTHLEMGAKMVPFAGWEMPVWYSSVLEEHRAVREAAGLFDVTHMGVYQAEGPDAGMFLDSVCGNEISALEVGQSCYTHFLDQNANVIDDLLVYRRGKEKFLAVVNASNDDKDWAWLNAVRKGEVRVDNKSPWAVAFGRNVILRNLRDPSAGDDMRIDIALQGPRSRDILLNLQCSLTDRCTILALNWAELGEVTLDEIPLVVSRTGYTGERMGFELFVHPQNSVKLWKALLKAGEDLGIKPCGLGARDSLRTEAGLPLYGHEMGGRLNLGVGQAGFNIFVKTYKPWFIGRDSYLLQESTRESVVVRFRFDEKRTRMAHLGDPVVDDHGKVIGTVTSCAIDYEGTLTGQAYILEKYSDEGTGFFIYQGSPSKADKSPAELNLGDRVTLPSRASVISRFLK
jgi:glycine hydroxymethyltransferase